MLLELIDVSISYGKVNAVHGISVAVREGTVITIIGANGAGKSTTLRAISGLVRPRSGEIRFEGNRIDNLSPDRIVAKGISQVPEGRRIFPEMTVEENLRTGAFLRNDRLAIESDLRSIYEQFPRLAERRRKDAKTLSGGEQQMLAIGRALMSRPRLLLLDEPSMGLAPVVVDDIASTISRIAGEGMTVVLVEQNAELAIHLADYAYVLESGKVALEGDTESLHDDEHVRAAYLGL